MGATKKRWKNKNIYMGTSVNVKIGPYEKSKKKNECQIKLSIEKKD